MKRTALVLLKELNAGQKASISAILMGQIALSENDIYSRQNIFDKQGFQHAAIRFSTVALQAKSETQLHNFLSQHAENNDILVVIFSRFGLSLNNAFEEYSNGVKANEIKALGVVGIAVTGDDAVVRQVTKKFSLVKED